MLSFAGSKREACAAVVSNAALAAGLSTWCCCLWLWLSSPQALDVLASPAPSATVATAAAGLTAGAACCRRWTGAERWSRRQKGQEAAASESPPESTTLWAWLGREIRNDEKGKAFSSECSRIFAVVSLIVSLLCNSEDGNKFATNIKRSFKEL